MKISCRACGETLTDDEVHCMEATTQFCTKCHEISLNAFNELVDQSAIEELFDQYMQENSWEEEEDD